MQNIILDEKDLEIALKDETIATKDQELASKDHEMISFKMKMNQREETHKLIRADHTEMWRDVLRRDEYVFYFVFDQYLS